jgi:hypothetical protein
VKRELTEKNALKTMTYTVYTVKSVNKGKERKEPIEL